MFDHHATVTHKYGNAGPSSDLFMVYIVLVNWKGAFDTLRCLESIFRSKYTNYKVLVVDNLSEDGSVEIIDLWAHGRMCLAERGDSYVESLSFPPIGIKIPFLRLSSGDLNPNNNHEFLDRISDVKLVLIENSENSGFGAGNNVALKLIKTVTDCSYFWLLNNDTVVTKKTLGELVQFCADHPRSVIGSILHYYDKPNQIQAAGGGFFNSFTGKVRTLEKKCDDKLDFINGASFFAPVAYLYEIGLFDENIFMYFEENDYCIRGKKLGFLFRSSEAIVYHKMGGSNLGSERAWQQIFKNKYYVMKKHFGVGAWQLFYFGALIVNSTHLNANPAKRSASRATLKNFIKRIQRFS